MLQLNDYGNKWLKRKGLVQHKDIDDFNSLVCDWCNARLYEFNFVEGRFVASDEDVVCRRCNACDHIPSCCTCPQSFESKMRELCVK